MDFKLFCENIQLPKEAVNTIENCTLSNEDYNMYRKLFYHDMDKFFEIMKSHKNYRQLFLTLYTHFAIDTYEEYQLKNIADSVYFDTFSDLTIWYNNCVRDFEESGLNAYGWLCHHIKMELFRIGRLQFQPQALSESLIINNTVLPKGQIVLNVHIPQGGPLIPEECERSYEMAREFFEGRQPVFVCFSWLMSTRLREVLEPNSNILKFQNRYHICSIDEEKRQAEERIFIQVQDNPDNYPENTSLQKNVKKYLQSGKKIGVGIGVFIDF